MAIYNLFHGGYVPELGKPCRDCGAVDELQLPVTAQPDNRADGAYGFRDKVEWKSLMRTLFIRYGNPKLQQSRQHRQSIYRQTTDQPK
ncbi:hypothetical protein [Actinobacillus minor]|uniref:hypothetical protein n=1 Tax=Actinobacillus minor TaxID=51047 RepID=UPI0026E9B6FA|nr:hypothetical protein [Actinobacillus minor]